MEKTALPMPLRLPTRARGRGSMQALFVAGVVGIASTAHGQAASGPSTSTQTEAASSGGASSGEEAATENRRQMMLVPSLSVESTWTDNIQLRGAPEKTSDFVTSVAPRLLFTSDGDRFKGSVDYTLTRFVHARDRSLDRGQNGLRALGSLEMAENFAFLDVSGNISQQTISAFGTRSGSDINDNSNRTETAVYRLSPYVRGQLGDWAQYEARYARTSTRSKTSIVGANNDANDLTLRLGGTNQQRFLNWSLDVSRLEQKYSTGRAVEADRVRAFVIHAFSPQLSLSLIPGWESNNYASLNKESTATIGGQVQWALSDRTHLSALLEKRFFGQSYAVSFEHRTPRTAWRVSDSRDATTTSNQAGSTSMGSLYDLYFYQFTSIEPDPIRRAQLVNSFLAANGLDGTTSIDLGFLTSGATLSRRQDASFTLIGLRDTLTFLASQSETSSLSRVTTGQDDLVDSSFVRQHGFSLVYSRRLTPLSSLNVAASTTRSSGEQSSSQGTQLRSLNVSLSTRLGENVTGTLGLRRTLSDSRLFSSYTESAVRGGLSFKF